MRPTGLVLVARRRCSSKRVAGRCRVLGMALGRVEDEAAKEEAEAASGAAVAPRTTALLLLLAAEV